MNGAWKKRSVQWKNGERELGEGRKRKGRERERENRYTLFDVIRWGTVHQLIVEHGLKQDLLVKMFKKSNIVFRQVLNNNY